MTSALFVVSEQGYWGEECVAPLTALEDAGVDVTVATPTGSPPEVDDQSVDPETVGEETAERVQAVHDSHPELGDPEPIAEVSSADHDAVVLPGGHGTVWDLTSTHPRRGGIPRAVWQRATTAPGGNVPRAGTPVRGRRFGPPPAGGG